MDIRGRVSEADARRLAGFVERAMAPLGLSEVSLVVRRRLRRGGAIASAERDGQVVWMHPHALRFSDDELFLLVCEEIAHCALMRAGGPTGSATFHDAIIQEAFAHWYAYTQSVGRWAEIAGHGESSLTGARLDHERGYWVGGAVGRAVGGSSSAKKALTDWRTTTLLDPGFDAMVRRLTRIMESETDPKRMCAALASFYAARSAGDGSLGTHACERMGLQLVIWVPAGITWLAAIVAFAYGNSVLGAILLVVVACILFAALWWLRRRRGGGRSADDNESVEASVAEFFNRLMP